MKTVKQFQQGPTSSITVCVGLFVSLAILSTLFATPVNYAGLAVGRTRTSIQNEGPGRIEHEAKLGDLVITVEEVGEVPVDFSPINPWTIELRRDWHLIAVRLRVNNIGTEASCSSFYTSLQVGSGSRYSGMTFLRNRPRRFLPGKKQEFGYTYNVPKNEQVAGLLIETDAERNAACRMLRGLPNQQNEKVLISLSGLPNPHRPTAEELEDDLILKTKVPESEILNLAKSNIGRRSLHRVELWNLRVTATGIGLFSRDVLQGYYSHSGRVDNGYHLVAIYVKVKNVASFKNCCTLPNPELIDREPHSERGEKNARPIYRGGMTFSEDLPDTLGLLPGEESSGSYVYVVKDGAEPVALRMSCNSDGDQNMRKADGLPEFIAVCENVTLPLRGLKISVKTRPPVPFDIEEVYGRYVIKPRVLDQLERLLSSHPLWDCSVRLNEALLDINRHMALAQAIHEQGQWLALQLTRVNQNHLSLSYGIDALRGQPFASPEEPEEVLKRFKEKLNAFDASLSSPEYNVLRDFCAKLPAE